MILPFSTALGRGKPPYVTLGIVLLCLVIHQFQAMNRDAIDAVAQRYCAAIHDPSAGEETLDYLTADEEVCLDDLVSLHSLPANADLGDYYLKEEVTTARFEAYIDRVRAHLEAFERQAPASLDRVLSYDPSAFNPFQSLASGLSHADWWHVIGNLIFFLAFAPAVELLVGSALRFIGILVLIEFACDLTYSLITLGGVPVPSLGLSGVVMGVIGLSAYLMPWARIRTLVWFLIHVRVYYIPAWVLALWYTGIDAFTLFSRTDGGGTNLVAHVSGALAGYLLGVLLLKGRREETREQLADEIDFQRSRREDWLGMLRTYKGGKRQINEARREHQARLEYGEFLDELYRCVDTRRDSEAVVLLLERYALYAPSPEIYEEIFREMQKWRQGRALLCLGRLCISLLLEQRQPARALAVAGACVAVQADFALADPCELRPLSDLAVSWSQYELAYRLVRDAGSRYGESIDVAYFRLLEEDLLESRLEKPQADADGLQVLPEK